MLLDSAVSILCANHFAADVNFGLTLRERMQVARCPRGLLGCTFFAGPFRFAEMPYEAFCSTWGKIFVDNPMRQGTKVEGSIEVLISIASASPSLVSQR